MDKTAYCKTCSTRLSPLNLYDRCSGCQRIHGRTLRSNPNYHVCDTCGTSVHSSVRNHVCITEQSQREKQIEDDLKTGIPNYSTIKAMWGEIQDLRTQVRKLQDQLDTKEITDNIVPIMKRWEEELGGFQPVCDVSTEEEAGE